MLFRLYVLDCCVLLLYSVEGINEHCCVKFLFWLKKSFVREAWGKKHQVAKLHSANFQSWLQWKSFSLSSEAKNLMGIEKYLWVRFNQVEICDKLHNPILVEVSTQKKKWNQIFMCVLQKESKKEDGECVQMTNPISHERQFLRLHSWNYSQEKVNFKVWSSPRHRHHTCRTNWCRPGRKKS